jgi:hypothetical protein
MGNKKLQIAVVVLMLAGMVIYVMSMDLAEDPVNEEPGVPVPAAAE